MAKNILIILCGLIIGFSAVFFTVKKAPNLPIYPSLGITGHEVIGFLPYWLLDKADKNYRQYLTNLTYFGLTVGADGKIIKLTNPAEEDPGWYTLRTGKSDRFFNDAKKNGLQLSLLVFSSNEDDISQLIADPVSHADNLINDINPLMKQYGFTDLNLDIESTRQASAEARMNFTAFAKEIKKKLETGGLGTLTVDASPIVLIKPYLINLNGIGKIADRIVLMTYDYHYPGSYVTGPVAPVGGGGIDAEYDSQTAVAEALKIMPPDKIILGVPLYGYEWETIGDTGRSAVIPGTGLTASSRRISDFIDKCATCSIQLDSYAQEHYLIYKDEDTGTYHQIFYPDAMATAEKVKLVNDSRIEGIALWALGYEDNKILEPLKNYLHP